MRISVIKGDLATVSADAICTSTNPRLSLYEGTGGAVRERGGSEIKRACEELVEELRRTIGKSEFQVGSVHPTSPGGLPAKTVIHCVASDALHRSTKGIVAACVANALARASEESCRSIAMPVFATGHAALRFESAVEAMGEAIRNAPVGIESIVIVVRDEDRVDSTRRAFASMLHHVEVV